VVVVSIDGGGDSSDGSRGRDGDDRGDGDWGVNGEERGRMVSGSGNETFEAAAKITDVGETVSILPFFTRT
jgi:hypothetical protein